MKYWIDCEFNAYKGALLSMALIREDGKSLYLIFNQDTKMVYDPWVAKNVVPIMLDSPVKPFYVKAGTDDAPLFLQSLFQGDKAPHIIADWPDDINYFCQTVITGPGRMITVPKFTFELERVDSYPNNIKEAVQHNAWWDAAMLRYKMTGILPKEMSK